MSGLDLVRGIMEERLPLSPVAELFGFRTVLAEPGQVVIEAAPKPEFLNPYGTIHAGWASTLLDSAMSLAVQTLMQPGQAQTTLELKVNLVRAVLPDTGTVRAEGKVVHAGRQVATAEARLRDSRDRLLAHAVCTCLVTTPDKSR
jgi:uncharacterized protein (TIGR00369 family)